MQGEDVRKFYKKHCVEYGLMIFYESSNSALGYMLGEHYNFIKGIENKNPWYLYIPEDEYFEMCKGGEFLHGHFGDNIKDCLVNPPHHMPFLKYPLYIKAIRSQSDLNPDNCKAANDLINLRMKLMERWIDAASPFFEAYDYSISWGHVLPSMLNTVEIASGYLDKRCVELGFGEFQPYRKKMLKFRRRFDEIQKELMVRNRR